MLAGTEPIEPNLLGAAAKGMPAFEYLIYDPARDPVAESSDDPRFCEYLGAVGVNLADDATGIRAAWDPAEGDFLGELVEAGRGSKTYDSIEMALGAVVNRLVYDLEAVRGEKLGVPLGMRTGGDVQPDSAESRFSGRSLEDVRDSLRGIEEVVFGAAVEEAGEPCRISRGHRSRRSRSRASRGVRRELRGAGCRSRAAHGSRRRRIPSSCRRPSIPWASSSA